jgi:hypothetical protein
MLAIIVACESLPPADPVLRLMPREIRTGYVESAISPVEREIAQEELAEAVGRLVSEAPQCFAWPTLWLDQQDRRSSYVARFDLMARDWGADLAAESERRMNEFVEMGLLARRERAPGVVEFTLTPEGRSSLKGSPYGASHPSFCPPAGRRLVQITNVEWGSFSCGNVQVSFTHGMDAWPEWARTQYARERLESTWGPLGSRLEGRVSLSRRWYRRESVPSGVRNGSLQSVCYDAAREQVVGDDLQMNQRS